MLGLIVIFVLLGLALLVGGVGAIVDGWPYLVLERGFTQVIIGTVAATAGLILLALSWVLVELRRMKASLTAVTLLSAATALPREPGEDFVSARKREPMPSAPEPESKLPGLGTVASGAGLAAAGGALATVFADRGIGKSREPDEEEPPTEAPAPAEPEKAARDEGESAQPDMAQTDIFDEALVDVAATKEAGDEALADTARGPDELEQSSEVEPQPAFARPDEAEHEDIDTGAADVDTASAESDDHFAVAPEPQAPEEPEPVKEPEPVAEPERREEAKRSWWPRFGSRAQEPAPGHEAGEIDDLTALRQRLTLGPQPPMPPAEPEQEGAGEPHEEGERREVEAWTAPPFGRREPSFDAFLPAEQAQPEPEERTEPVETWAEDAGPDEQLAAEAEEAEPPAEEPPPAEPPRPAASEEGVIGAYQVGDTHFTMYADGSIKARTPDGEYSFASMDELRAYLASEKSRLGA